MAEEAQNQENSIQELKEKLLSFEKERNEYLEGWKRAKADFLNYKKEEAKRVEEWIKFSNEAVIKELLPIIDSFDFGLTVLENDPAAQKGMRLIKAQLEDVLRRYGLEKIKIEIGEKFEPLKHEAVAEVDSDKSQGTITEILGSGYTLHGKVIRPARVKVGR